VERDRDRDSAGSVRAWRRWVVHKQSYFVLTTLVKDEAKNGLWGWIFIAEQSAVAHFSANGTIEGDDGVRELAD
jgi:hypothetical protein